MATAQTDCHEVISVKLRDKVVVQSTTRTDEVGRTPIKDIEHGLSSQREGTIVIPKVSIEAVICGDIDS